MEFKQLQRFLSIIDHGSFQKAAKALGVSQQALRVTIMNRERESGVKTLDRGRGGVTRSTPYGRILVRHARAQETAQSRALKELHALRDAEGGSVSMGIGESFASEIVATAVSRFHEARPDIKINLIEGYSEDLLEKLRRGQIDFLAGSIGFETESDDLMQMTLYSRQDVIVARRQHPLAGKANLGLNQLAEYTWLVPANRPSDKEAILKAFAAENIVPPSRFIGTDAYTVGLQLLLANDYLIMTSPALIGHQKRADLLSVLDINRPTVQRHASLCYLRNASLSPASNAMIEEIRTVAVPSTI